MVQWLRLRSHNAGELGLTPGKGTRAQLVKNPPAMHAGDPGLIPGLGRSPGEGLGYPLQYSWASLVVQSVKNLPWGAGGNPLEKGMATLSSTVAWRIPMDREAWRATVHELQRVGRD